MDKISPPMSSTAEYMQSNLHNMHTQKKKICRIYAYDGWPLQTYLS